MQIAGIHTMLFQGQTIHLHPFRALFWEETSALLIADFHLGKVTHFRRSGIPVPQGAGDENWDRLHNLLVDFVPQKVLFLGDLFHSDYNGEWEALRQLTGQFKDTSFGLVLGNHDRLDQRHYEEAHLQVYEEPLLWEPFLLSHHPIETVSEGRYNLSGHIHPCVRLHGAGRQRLRLPCFYFGERQGILPAFGSFTGLGDVEVRVGDRVFVIAEDRVVEAV